MKENGSAAIRTAGLTKTFGPTVAVDSIDLEVSQGELFGLVGPDGAGKTTTMRLLAAILSPTSGEAFVSGFSILSEGEQIKERIGYMAQRFGLYEDLTVMENIDFYADLYEVPSRERPERIERLLGFSNLTPFRKRLAGNLSGGMKQKLGLACALIHRPEVLFLDEPTCGVDPVSRRDFWRILYSLLKEGITVFISTAYLDEAERCTRIGLMNKGEILEVDEPGSMRRRLPVTMVEIVSPQARSARDILTESSEVRRVSMYGERLHVSVTDPAAVARVRGLLAEARIPCLGIRSITPSLEDVFIEFVEEGRAGKETHG